MNEKIQVVFKESQKKWKYGIDFLLTARSDWAMDANPFMIVDAQLAKKIEGKEFGGRPVKAQLISKYPYLKTVLEDQDEDLELLNEVKNEAEPEPETVTVETEEHQDEEPNYELLVEGKISEVKEVIEFGGLGLDIAKVIEAEKANSNRKSLIKYLEECQ